MRRTALALSTALVALTATRESLAVPAFYNEVIKDLGATGCPPSTQATVSGCLNLCHVQDPNAGGALPPVDPGPLYTLLTTEFGWSGYTTLNAATLDGPLAKLEADTTYANVVATVKNGCQDPAAEIAADNPSLAAGSSGPSYGCALDAAPAGRARGALLPFGLAIVAMLAARRRRRQP